MGKNKPYDAEVEYLEVNESTGQAWIDTGYVPNDKDIIINIKFLISSWVSDYDAGSILYAQGDDKTNDIRIQRAYIRGSNVLCVTSPQYYRDTIPSIKGVETELIIDGYDGIFTYNGQTVNLTERDSQTDTDKSLLIFGTGMFAIYAKIYHIKIYKKDSTILDLIPVRIGDEGFLYNRVDGKLFGNEDTKGSRFAVGPDIN